MGGNSGGGGNGGRTGGGGNLDESKMDAWDPDTYQNLGFKGGPPTGKLVSDSFKGASNERVNVSPDAYKRKATVTQTTRERYNPATGNIHLYENGKPTGETRKAGPMEKYEYKKGRLPGI